MLDMMRRQSSLIYVIFGGIIFIFAINFGPSSSGCAGAQQPQTWAAKVNGAKIRQQEFILAYSQQFEYMRRLSEQRGLPNFTQAMAERYGIRRHVVEQLVDRKLLAQEAARVGVVVPDAVLAKHLQQQYGLKDVDAATYEGWVRRTFDMRVEQFEETVRDDLAAQLLAQIIGRSIGISDNELQDDYMRQHNRAKVQFVRFDPDLTHIAEPAVEDIKALLQNDKSAVEAFYEKNQHLYVQETNNAQPQLKPFEEVQEAAAVATLKARAADMRAKQQADNFLAALLRGKKWQDLTDAEEMLFMQDKLAHASSGKPVLRSSAWVLPYKNTIGRIGESKELQEDIFKLTLQQPLSKKVYKIETSYVVVALKIREIPHTKDFIEEKLSFRQETLEARREAVLQDLLAYLRNQAKVQMNPGLLNGPIGQDLQENG